MKERERLDREKAEREREMRDRKEREDRERKEQQRVADAVHQHFEESLRLAAQKPGPGVSKGLI